MAFRIIFLFCVVLFSATICLAQDFNSSAPDFSSKDLSGNPIKLSELKGKVVVLDFWASWCVPCKKSMPHLISLYNDNISDSLIIIGINVDTQLDKIKEFQNSIGHEITFPIIFDSESKIPPLYNIDAMPTTIVINREGVIKFKEEGYSEALKDKLDKTIKELLAK